LRTPDQTAKVIEVLVATPDKVGTLVLADCAIDIECTMLLADLMQITQTLASLDLSGCFPGIREAGNSSDDPMMEVLGRGIGKNDSISTLRLERNVLTSKAANHLEAGLWTNRWLTSLKLGPGCKHNTMLQRPIHITTKVHNCARRMQECALPPEELSALLLECGTLGKASLVPTLLELGASARTVNKSGQSIHAILFGCTPGPTTTDALLLAYQKRFVLDAAVIAAVESNESLQLLQQIVMALAAEKWKAPDGTGRSVLQCIVDCCLNKGGRQDALKDQMAVALAAAVVSVCGSSWVHDTDVSGRTVPKTVALCFDNPDLQELLGVVVYGRFALVAPDSPLSSTPSVLVYECADCHNHLDKLDVAVITMFENECAWRDLLEKLSLQKQGRYCEEDVVRVAAKKRLTSSLPAGPKLCLYEDISLVERASDPALALMEQYPFAVVVRGQAAKLQLATDSAAATVTPPPPRHRTITNPFNPNPAHPPLDPAASPPRPLTHSPPRPIPSRWNTLPAPATPPHLHDLDNGCLPAPAATPPHDLDQSPLRFSKSRLPVRTLTGTSLVGDSTGNAIGGGSEHMCLISSNYSAVDSERRAKMTAVRRCEIAESNCKEMSGQVAALQAQLVQLQTLLHRQAEAAAAAPSQPPPPSPTSPSPTQVPTTEWASVIPAPETLFESKLADQAHRADAAEAKSIAAFLLNKQLQTRMHHLEQLLDQHQSEQTQAGESPSTSPSDSRYDVRTKGTRLERHAGPVPSFTTISRDSIRMNRAGSLAWSSKMTARPSLKGAHEDDKEVHTSLPKQSHNNASTNGEFANIGG
jgi:hypothetical protein